MIKIRNMRRSDWTRITERKYAERDYIIGGKRARQSLLFIKKVKEPCVVGKKRIVIADEGYGWVQEAVEGSRVWLTAMFDCGGNFLQIYFDITAGNCFDDPGNPTFQDMYLDVVVTGSYETEVLDENELQEAFDDGTISEEQYLQAKADCEQLVEWLKGREMQAVEHCREIYLELMGDLKRRVRLGIES